MGCAQCKNIYIKKDIQVSFLNENQKEENYKDFQIIESKLIGSRNILLNKSNSIDSTYISRSHKTNIFNTEDFSFKNTEHLFEDSSNNKIEENIKNLNIEIFNISNEKFIDKVSICKNKLFSEINNYEVYKEDSYINFSFGNINKLNKNLLNDNNNNKLNIKKSIDYNLDDNGINFHQFNIELLNNDFYIKEGNESNGIFLKINKKILLDYNKLSCQSYKNYIFIDNKNYLNLEVNVELNILFIYYNNKKYLYNPLLLSCFKIGRSKDCNLIINSNGISRVQMTIKYNKERKEFYLYDGNINDENNEQIFSKNGIWMLLNDKLKIENEMILKTGNIKMKCLIN